MRTHRLSRRTIFSISNPGPLLVLYGKTHFLGDREIAPEIFNLPEILP